MTYFRDNMAPMLNWWPVKVLVAVMFVCYISGACYGITCIKEGLERRKLSRSDSYSVEFYDREDFYFREFPYRIQVTMPTVIKQEGTCHEVADGGRCRQTLPSPEPIVAGEAFVPGLKLKGCLCFL
jgi:hypothetical protein